MSTMYVPGGGSTCFFLFFARWIQNQQSHTFPTLLHCCLCCQQRRCVQAIVGLKRYDDMACLTNECCPASHSVVM